jgi:hypothetical protein
MIDHNDLEFREDHLDEEQEEMEEEQLSQNSVEYFGGVHSQPMMIN